MDSFDRFWAAYPKRYGSNPKAPARAKFERFVRAGADPEAIIGGARAYAEQESKNVGTPYIAMASTWLNQKRWEDYAMQKTEIVPMIDRVFVEVDTPQWAAWVAWRKRTEGRSWMQTDHRIEGRIKRGWWFVSEWPPQAEAAE